jgi:hypothetical protein
MTMKSSTRWNRGPLAPALAALAFVAVGCGGGERAGTPVGASGGPEAVAASAASAAAPLAVVAGPPVPDAERVAEVSNDSLPPDVAASVTDSLIVPGTIVEITAEGSPDVEEILLSDGIGRPQRFVYDPAADLWRASYRVPVRVAGDRLGLAVTAKNELHRWRRVWVFLSVQREARKSPAPADEG